MARGLKEIVKEIHGEAATPGQGIDYGLDNYYYPRHIAWLKRQEKERAWSPAALEHARKVFIGAYQKPRENRISPSAFGGACDREVLFSFGGAPKLPSRWENEELMVDGSFDHLKWQMEGLSAGYLGAVEVFLKSEDLRMGGSLDGVGADHSLFELKNTAEHLFKAISTGKGTAKKYALGMVAKHKLQMEGYWLLDQVCPGPRILTDYGSLVYVNRANPSDVYEVRMKTDPGRRRQVEAILEGLHDWIDLDELPDLLEGCQATFGWLDRQPTQSERTVADRCKYREHCPTATTVISR